MADSNKEYPANFGREVEAPKPAPTFLPYVPEKKHLIQFFKSYPANVQPLTNSKFVQGPSTDTNKSAL